MKVNPKNTEDRGFTVFEKAKITKSRGNCFLIETDKIENEYAMAI